jgi:hypothetical protein
MSPVSKRVTGERENLHHFRRGWNLISKMSSSFVVFSTFVTFISGLLALLLNFTFDIARKTDLKKGLLWRRFTLLVVWGAFVGMIINKITVLFRTGRQTNKF